MNNSQTSALSWITGGSMLFASIAAGLYGVVNQATADDVYATYGGPPSYVELYQENCGDCHFAYPPTLLPQASWQLIMTNLSDHFGEDAELDNNDNALIKGYLVANSMSNLRRFSHSGEGAVPLRITELHYFQHEHEEIPDRLITNNDEVGSLSNCSSCHQTNSRKMFDDDRVTISGYGRWDD